VKKSKYTSISEINVTSLVDVTMVLLIIFMITAPLLRSGIEVDLPKSTAEDLKPYDGVVVTLTREGKIDLDGEKYKLDNFESILMKKYVASNRKTVLLQADKEVQYGKVITVMDRIKSVGIHNLGLIVVPEKDK
jgi:biopolymer transport protein TolR